MRAGLMTTDTKTETGAIWRAVDIVCDAPTLLILESCWLGIKRFDDFRKTTGLLKTVVSNRLKKLVHSDILKKHRYSDKPPRYEYLFTDMGFDLFPVALMMLRWEKKWSDPRGRVQVKLTHTACNQQTEPYCACAQCQRPVTAADTAREPGPAAEAGIGVYIKRRRQAGLKASKASATALFEDISDIFGDRWSALVLRAAFTGAKRYDGFLEATQASTNILTDRLKRLVEQGLLRKIPYQGNPVRHEYHLTPKALDIYPILLFLLEWGEKWFANDLGPSVYLTHIPCNTALKPKILCSACHQPVNRQNIQLNLSS